MELLGSLSHNSNGLSKTDLIGRWLKIMIIYYEVKILHNRFDAMKITYIPISIQKSIK